MSENTTVVVEEVICFLNGKKFMDVSAMQCLFTNLTLFLYNIHFPYICYALLFIIVIISLFGGIKADYRWFILNQAIWDIAITSSYLKNDLIYQFAYTGVITTYWRSGTYILERFLKDIIDTNPFTSLLLLSGSRFLALYYSNFYDRLTAKKRVFITIIVFNLIVIFFHTSGFLNQLLAATRVRLNRYCSKTYPNYTYTECTKWYKSQPEYIILKILFSIFKFIVLLKPIIFICLSIFAAIMILVKIGRQSKFQLKHNRRDFFVSLRVAIVIVFQTFINVILVFLEFTESIDDIFLDVFDITLSKYQPCQSRWENTEICVDFLQLPEWLDDDACGHGLESLMNYPAIKQLRIFLESIIVIALMAGYREAIIRFFKFLYSFVRKRSKISPSSLNNQRLFISRSSAASMSPNVT